MNKKAVIFLLLMVFLPIICLFLYFWIPSIMDGRSRREIYLDDNRQINYSFKIDTIFRDHRNHNVLTLKGIYDSDIETSPPEWENNIFKIGDSIVKDKGSLKIYIYRNSKLDTILDYNDISIR
ncbi:hypothetical protein [Bergeyella sp. RCAD1439]|uniref:hypothetical protein n=1 Tax=Bergeyella anatis TaxID=3113737 RepID=UPI002E1836A2|nr:hypothetical protein [Bergeyella sp. RCAD1439]